MEYRQLGRSGLKVPELCFGAGTFGTSGEFFQAWSKTSDEEATRIVDICMEAGLNFFDTADMYSEGRSETVLGGAIKHLKREDVLISTKATFPLKRPMTSSLFVHKQSFPLRLHFLTRTFLPGSGHANFRSALDRHFVISNVCYQNDISIHLTFIWKS